MKRKLIKHNDLLPWFLEDHGQLPASYLKSTQKFFDELRATSNKPQAASVKLSPQLNVLTTEEYKKLERKYKNENK
jgi:hypothetical protein